MKRFLAAIGLFCCLAVFAAEIIPPAPKLYFNDEAHVVSPQTALTLNSELEQFERSTSSQIVVAIFPKMQSDSSIEDYTYRVKDAWKVGQKGKDNGAVLFVFVQEHKMFLQTGYGLEGALPDATCKRIIDQEIAPRFKTGDYDGGLTAGVNAILAAAKGEYQGTGSTVQDARGPMTGLTWHDVLILIIVVIVLLIMIRIFGIGFVVGMLFNSSGYSSSRGGGGGSGGGFSGGGGRGGGGGAGGSW